MHQLSSHTFSSVTTTSHGCLDFSNIAGESKAFAAFPISIYSWNDPCQNFPLSAKRRLNQKGRKNLWWCSHETKIPRPFPGVGNTLLISSFHFYFFFRNMNYINAFCHVPGGLEGVDVLLSSTSLEKLFEMHRSELSPTTPSQSCFPVAFIFSTNSGDHLIHLSFPRWEIGLDEPIMRPKRSVRAGRWECFASANYFSGLDFSVKFWR